MAYTENEIENIISELQEIDARYIVSLFLAQPDDEIKPYVELGFNNWNQAYSEVSKLFNIKPNYVKNVRDHFDNHTDSSRIGFKAELKTSLKRVFDNYSNWDRNDLLNLAKKILASNWQSLSPTLKTEDLPDFFNDPLPDLSKCIEYCEDRQKKISIPTDIPLPHGFVSQLIENYQQIKPGDEISIIGNHSLSILTPENNYLAISLIELGRCWAVLPFVKALEKYINLLEKISNTLFEGSRSSTLNKQMFKQLPNQNWQNIVGSEKADEIINYLEEISLNDVEFSKRFILFLSDRKWSGIAKKLDRTDLLTSTITRIGGWLAVASDRRGELSIALSKTVNANLIINNIIDDSKKAPVDIESVANNVVTGGFNKTYYGAPSTGKSFAIKKLTEKSPDTVTRTVFHADTQNSDFIGCLKPSSEGGDISYTFQPGPFTTALIGALNSPSRMHYLIIEEINRAPAAAVFGEIFQLLDRDENGRTETGYEITPTDIMQANYIKSNFTSFNGKIYIPSNLTLLATMNSSDQAVMPMDTAFKRRWRFEYMPLDFDKACASGVIKICIKKGNNPLEVSWKNLALEINKILSNEELPEDRHLGPFFVSSVELSTPEKTIEALSGKVFMYLWDDVLRHKQKSIIFDSRLKTNGALMTAFKNDELVFCKQLLDSLKDIEAEAVRKSDEVDLIVEDQ